MPILNYTTEVAPEKTAAEIEKILVNHSARNVIKEYDEVTHELIGLYFTVKTPTGDICFRLPVRPSQVYEVLKIQLNWSNNRYWGDALKKMEEKRRQQSARVAWRIMKSWVEAQMALLEAQQVQIEEVFFAYAILPGSGGKTLFQHVSERNLLTRGNNEDGEFHEIKE
jgi:hypothetical protein